MLTFLLNCKYFGLFWGEFLAKTTSHLSLLLPLLLAVALVGVVCSMLTFMAQNDGSSAVINKNPGQASNCWTRFDWLIPRKQWHSHSIPRPKQLQPRPQPMKTDFGLLAKDCKKCTFSHDTFRIGLQSDWRNMEEPQIIVSSFKLTSLQVPGSPCPICEHVQYACWIQIYIYIYN